MNSTPNKFTRFLKNNAALLLIIFCVLAIAAVVLAVTLTDGGNNVLPDDDVVINPNPDEPDEEKPTVSKVYFASPVDYTVVTMDYTDGEDVLFVFNKTLNKNAKIKTYQSKKIHIHRTKPGVIHYDGDPVMAGEDIDVEIKPKGIKIIINPFANKNTRKPNALQNAVSDIMNEISNVREDIVRHRDATYRIIGKGNKKENE